MLSVKDALEIGRLKNCSVVAGQNGLDRIIRYVTVMEVPDISQWLKGGDFVITSLYSVRDSLEKQCRLIEELNRVNSAAIAIKTNRYISKIPDEVIKIANEKNFPVIEIPKNITYIDIMTPLMEKIFDLQNHFKIIEEYIREIIFHTYKNRASILERGRTLGYEIEEGCFYVFLTDINDFESIAKKFKYDERKLNALKENLYKSIYGASKDLSNREGVTDFLIFRKSDSVAVFMHFKNEDSAYKSANEFLKSIIRYSKYYEKEIKITIGVSSIVYGIEGLEKGYKQSETAIKFGRVLDKNKDYYKYNDFELFDMIFGEDLFKVEYVVNSTLGKLKNNEKLIETLLEYFDCNEDINMAAQKLYVHKNTLKYRVNSAESITGYDIKNINDKIKLYLGVTAYKMLSNMTKKD